MIKLNATNLMSKLSPESLSLIKQIYVFNELDSTNGWLLKHKGCGEICLAETQMQGRGRRGRSWSSPDAGNIYLSMSWCFDLIPEQFPLISLITGISLCEVLDSSGLQGHGIKWPNDILINQQKIAGILVETSGSLQHVVIGIGINLSSTNQKQTDQEQGAQHKIQQPWCSLDDVMDNVPQRDDLILGIINNLAGKMSTLSSLSFLDFNQQWKQWDLVIDRSVTIFTGAGSINGLAKGIDKQGHILVELENNVLKSFHSAEVSLRC